MNKKINKLILACAKRGLIKEATMLIKIGQESEAIEEQIEGAQSQVKNMAGEIGNYFNLLKGSIDELEQVLEGLAGAEIPESDIYQAALGKLERFEGLSAQMKATIMKLRG